MFADFALLGALPSYGGAEVLRARRYRQGQFEPPVHLALYGAARIGERICVIADAAGQVSHERLARIHEVGVCDSMLFAVTDPVEGIDVEALLELHRRRKEQIDPALAIAISLGVSQLAHDMQDSGDVWAADRGAGLSSIFVAGLRLDGVVLSRDGSVFVRSLAAAAADPRKPTAFRAPELQLRGKRALATSDVFACTQLLRALVTTDPTATAAPRLRPQVAKLGPVIAAGLVANPDERLSLFMLLERLAITLSELAGTRSPADIIASAVLREAVPSPEPDRPLTDDDKRKLRQPARTDRLWPGRSMGLSSEDFVEDSEPGASTIAMPRYLIEQSDHVDRVFTDEGGPIPTTVSAPPASPVPPPQPIAAPVLDEAAATFSEDEQTVQTPLGKIGKTSVSDPPWVSMSDIDLVDEKTSPLLPPRRAPVMRESQVEGGPTQEMKLTLDDDDPEKTQG